MSVLIMVWIAVIGGAIGAIIYYAFADVWVVPSDDPQQMVSIQPTIAAGDVLLVKRHGTNLPGNLLRCVDPDEPRRFVVGRLAVTGGKVHIAGQQFSTAGSRPAGSGGCGTRRLVNPADGNEVELGCREEDFAGTEYNVLMKLDDQQGAPQDLTAPPGKNFLISDNRYMHLDSRDYGAVNDATCQQLIFRLWGAEGFTQASRRFNLIW